MSAVVFWLLIDLKPRLSPTNGGTSEGTKKIHPKCNVFVAHSSSRYVHISSIFHNVGTSAKCGPKWHPKWGPKTVRKCLQMRTVEQLGNESIKAYQSRPNMGPICVQLSWKKDFIVELRCTKDCPLALPRMGLTFLDRPNPRSKRHKEAYFSLTMLDLTPSNLPLPLPHIPARAISVAKRLEYL